MLSLWKTKIEFHYLSLTSANCHCENTILFQHMIYANQPVNGSNMVPCIYAYFQPPSPSPEPYYIAIYRQDFFIRLVTSRYLSDGRVLDKYNDWCYSIMSV